MTRKKNLLLLLSALAPLALLLLRPLGMNWVQSGILAAMMLTIIWWASGIVDRTIASAFMLLVFLLFSGAPVKTIFTFPLSENFLMIVFAFLFSQGISNSGLTAKLLQPLLIRFAKTPARLIACMLLCALVMIFIIPQPFSRIIILSAIYSEFFDSLPCVREHKELKSVLMVAQFIIAVLSGMLLLRGDIILNNALLITGGISLSESQWMRYMSVPTAGYLLLAIVLFYSLFRKELRLYQGGAEATPPERAALTAREKLNLLFILAVVVFWAAEDLHGISGTVTVIVGTALMFPLGLLHLPDFKAVNIKLLVFTTAAFAIGGVLKACGVADILFSPFTALFPPVFSAKYALIVLLTATLLHMVLGSNVTTLSVVVPGLMAVGEGVAPGIPLMLLIYIAVCGHFLLPYHHVVLLLGEGKGYYGSNRLIRFGIPLSVLMIGCAMTIYMGWWHLIGLV